MKGLACSSARRRGAAMTLIELLISMCLGVMVLLIVMVLFLFGLRSFAALGNYAALTGQSHLAFDHISRDIQEATQVLEAQTNLPVKWLTLSNALAEPPLVTKYSWDSTTGVLTCERTGQPLRTNLTGCEAWDFFFYQSLPASNWTFSATTDPSHCRSISMSWKCSRTVMGQKVNTEESFTGQIVRRNNP